ncbi:hypothetical protein DAI22_01g170700 [Oryza sativa Japonica Group]|nr:hypothetical protein DAI22_01g170700 [Oryza sativa Japonica Group]
MRMTQWCWTSLYLRILLAVVDCIKGKLHWRVSAVMDANVVTLLIQRFEWPQYWLILILVPNHLTADEPASTSNVFRCASLLHVAIIFLCV